MGTSTRPYMERYGSINGKSLKKISHTIHFYSKHNYHTFRGANHHLCTSIVIPSVSILVSLYVVFDSELSFTDVIERRCFGVGCGLGRLTHTRIVWSSADVNLRSEGFLVIWWPQQTPCFGVLFVDELDSKWQWQQLRRVKILLKSNSTIWIILALWRN